MGKDAKAPAAARARWAARSQSEVANNLSFRFASVAALESSVAQSTRKFSHAFVDRELEKAFHGFFRAGSHTVCVRAAAAWFALAVVWACVEHAGGQASPGALACLHALWVLLLGATVAGLRLSTHARSRLAPAQAFALGSCVVFALAAAALHTTHASRAASCDEEAGCLRDEAEAHAVALCAAFAALGGGTALAVRNVVLHAATHAALVVVAVAVVAATWDDLGGAARLGLAIVLVIGTVVSVSFNRHADALRRAMFAWHHHATDFAKEQMEKLETEKNHKHRVMAYLFHEVRNPVNNIYLASSGADDAIQAISETIGNALDKKAEIDIEQVGKDLDECHEMVRIIANSSQTASHVLDDALSLENLELGKFQFVHAPFTLNSMYLPPVQATMPNFHRKLINVSLEIEDGLDTTIVRGDLKRLQQVIDNFLGNACKYTPEHGKVVLGLRCAERSGAMGTVALRLTVSDTGCGMTQAEQDTLFQPWVEIQAGAKQDGRGLGLSLSKDFIQRGHNGVLGVQSPGLLGSGCTFYFEVELPVLNMRNGTLVEGHAERGSPTPSMRFASHFSVSSNRDSDEEFNPSRPRRESAARRWKEVDLDGEDGSSVASESPRQLTKRPTDPEGNGAPAPKHNAPVGLPEQMLDEPRLAPEGANHEHADEEEAPANDGGGGEDESAAGGEPEEFDVLVVDDSDTTTKLVCRLLTSLGLTSLSCGNGQAAVRMATRHDFKVIMMDKEMPIMDGHEATEKIRKLKPSVPVIGVTSNAMDSQRREFIRHGAAEVLPKPINKDKLRDLMKRYGVLE